MTVTAGANSNGAITLNTGANQNHIFSENAVSRLVIDNVNSEYVFNTYNLAAEDGSAAAPSYAFISDATSGIYLGGSTLGFSSAGALVFQTGAALVRSYQHLYSSEGLSVTGATNDQGQVGQFAFVDVSSGVGRFGSYNYDTVAWQPVVVRGGGNVDIDAQDAGGVVALQVNTVDRFIVDGTNGRFDFNDYSIFVEERASAVADVANYGQFWVRNDAPNVPMFTDDAGNDQLIDPSVSPIEDKTANYTLVLADKGKTIRATSGTLTFTIPANSSVAYPIGTLISFDNDSGNNLTIAITTDTLEGTDGVSGSKTLGDHDTAVIQKVTATKWKYAASDL